MLKNFDTNFKFIDGFNNRYSITANGIVYSHIIRNGGLSKYPIRELTQHINKGYKRVALRKEKWDDKLSSKYVHVLVAEAFCNKHSNVNVEVNHIDGDKTNNKACNLEWVTHSANVEHAWDTGLSKGRSVPRTLYIGTSKTDATDIVGIFGSQNITKFGFTKSCIDSSIRKDKGRLYHKKRVWSKIVGLHNITNYLECNQNIELLNEVVNNYKQI